MNNHYEINDEVWIHLTGPNLVKGRIVTTINFEETYYIIEIPCYIEKFYEIRKFEQISSSQEGPINLFKGVPLNEASNFFTRIGITLPSENNNDTTIEPSPKPNKKKFRYSRKRKNKD